VPLCLPPLAITPPSTARQQDLSHEILVAQIQDETAACGIVKQRLTHLAHPHTSPLAVLTTQSYDGVGEKVADFVKRYKDMQADLTETKQRLAVAEDYKAKYELLKTDMDEILGNQ
jgi:hypothetical protein